MLEIKEGQTLPSTDMADLQEVSHIAESTAYQEQWNEILAAALWLKAAFMLEVRGEE